MTLFLALPVIFAFQRGVKDLINFVLAIPAGQPVAMHAPAGIIVAAPHIYKTAPVWLVRAEGTKPPGGPGADAPRPVDAEFGAMTEWPRDIYDVLKEADIRQVSYVPDAGHARPVYRSLDRAFSER